MAKNKLTDMIGKIDNPAISNIEVTKSFISSASEEAPAASESPKAAIAPRKKSLKAERLNLLISPVNKIKLQKMVDREGYKSVNDYINYLIEVAVSDEAEPTKAELNALESAKEQRKKK